jgi:hypothetical protein
LVVNIFGEFRPEGFAEERVFLFRVLKKARIANLGQLEVRQFALLVYLARAIGLAAGFWVTGEITD